MKQVIQKIYTRQEDTEHTYLVIAVERRNRQLL